jgi:hypothetical protein
MYFYSRENPHGPVAYILFEDTKTEENYHTHNSHHACHGKEFIYPPLPDEDNSPIAQGIRSTLKELKEQHARLLDRENIARSEQTKRTFLALPLVLSHPYLEKKGIPRLNLNLSSLGLRQDQEGSLVVPVSLPNPDYFTYQTIHPTDPIRRFTKGASTKGAFLAIPRPDITPDQIYLSEGLATALTTHALACKALPEVTILTFACFSANNIPEVAKYVSKRYPNSKITILADDDFTRTPNTGWLYAKKAARENPKIRVLLPSFPRTVVRGEKDTDINDAWRLSDYAFEDHIENIKISYLSERIYVSEGGNGEFFTLTKGKDETEFIPPTALNINTALRQLGVTPFYNSFSKLYSASAPSHIGQRWSNFDWICSMFWAELPKLGISVSLQKLKEIIPVLANRVSIHPRKEYFLSLPAKWDGIKRAEDHLIRLGGAPDTAITRIVTKRFLIGQYGRAVIPGFKNDMAPIIYSKTQGYSKSRYCEALAFREDWFTSGDILDQKTSNVMAITAGIGIIEIAEAEGLKGSSNERTKANVTRTKDRDRMAYDKFATEDYREWSMIITTNDRKPLTDMTGNRRFPIIEITKNIDVNKFIEEREQIMAEIGVMFSQGERAWLNDEEYKLLTDYQEDWISPSKEMGLREFFEDTLPEDGDRFATSDLRLAMEAQKSLSTSFAVLESVMATMGFRRAKGEFGKLNRVWGYSRGDLRFTKKIYVAKLINDKVVWVTPEAMEKLEEKSII